MGPGLADSGKKRSLTKTWLSWQTLCSDRSVDKQSNDLRNKERGFEGLCLASSSLVDRGDIFESHLSQVEKEDSMP